jgi:superfamily II DNA helicase RecQ
LREIARRYPATESELAGIRNVGLKKVKDFGSLFMVEIADHLRTNPRQTF